MRARLHIDSYIIDSADTSSSSTTAGVKLALDEAEPLTPTIEGNEYRWPIMYAYVTAANEGALKTALDALEQAVRNCSGLTIKFEETNGTTLKQMHANLWPQAEAAFEVEQGDTTAEVAFSFTGRQAGPVAAGAADEPGIVGNVVWSYSLLPGGSGAMTAQAVFGPTMSGDTVSAGTRQNALAWINKLANTANFPPFLATTFRRIGAPEIEFDQRLNVAALTEADYNPCLVTQVFAELQPTLAAMSAFASGVERINTGSAVEPRSPLPGRAGQKPGFDLVLFGDFTLKVMGNTTFNASDTRIADTALKAKADEVALACTILFESVYNSMNLVRWNAPLVSIDFTTGLCTFNVRYTGDGGILEWDESTQLTNVDQKIFARATDGTDWEFEMKGGPIRLLVHTLRVVSSSPVTYRKPSLGKDWSRMEAVAEPITKLRFTDDGNAQYVTVGSVTYRYVNPSKGANAGNVRNSFNADSVGNGHL